MLVKDTTVIARSRPTAYTLIELLVAMAIIAFLAGLLILMWPGLSSSSQSTRNADSVQGMLLVSKQKAIRDGVPTGVRLLLDPNDVTGTHITQLVYIRQPTPFTPPISAAGVGTLVGQAQSVQAPAFYYVDFTGGLAQPTDYPVQAGDYLEINGGGPLHQITSVTPPQVMGSGPAVSNLYLIDSVTVPVSTTNWRIIRQPRPVVGEEPLVMTGTIIIDLSLSMNIPTRYDANGNPYYEIMFAPSGSVIGQGTSSNDKIILYVRDGSQANPTANVPVLIGIQVGTGLIGGYPVDYTQVGGDYYTNTRDPHASGM